MSFVPKGMYHFLIVPLDLNEIISTICDHMGAAIEFERSMLISQCLKSY